MSHASTAGMHRFPQRRVPRASPLVRRHSAKSCLGLSTGAPSSGLTFFMSTAATPMKSAAPTSPIVLASPAGGPAGAFLDDVHRADLRCLLRIPVAGGFDHRDILRRLGGGRPRRARQDRVSLSEFGVFLMWGLSIRLYTRASPPFLRRARTCGSSATIRASSCLAGCSSGRVGDLSGRNADPQIHRRRQTVDHHLRGHVSLPDDRKTGCCRVDTDIIC